MALNLTNVASRVVVLKFQEELEKRRQQVAAQPRPAPIAAPTAPLRAMATPMPMPSLTQQALEADEIRRKQQLAAQMQQQAEARRQMIASGNIAPLAGFPGGGLTPREQLMYETLNPSGGSMAYSREAELPPPQMPALRQQALIEAAKGGTFRARSPLSEIPGWERLPSTVRNPAEMLINAQNIPLVGLPVMGGIGTNAKILAQMAAGQLAGGIVGERIGGETGEQIGGTIGMIAGPFAPAGYRKATALTEMVGQRYPAVREAAVGGEAGGLKLPFGKKAGEEAAAVPPTVEPRVQKLLDTVDAVMKTEPTRLGQLSEKRLVMDAQIKEIRASQTLTPEEKMSQIQQVRKGVTETAFEVPEGVSFTRDDIDFYHQTIMDSLTLKSQEAGNAYEALDKMLSGDYIPPERRHLLRLAFGDVFGDMADQAMKPQNYPKWKYVIDTLGIPRIVKASVDISWPLRQGIMKVGSPSFYRAWKPGIKAISEKSATESYADIIGSAHWAEYGADSGLAVADPSGMAGVAKTVEGYVTYTGEGPAAWVERLPGIKQSQQVYATMGNEVRWRELESTVEGWKKIGADFGERQVKAAARWQNISTGWGYLGDLEKNLPALAQVLFAPRFWASVLQRIPYGIYLIAKEPLMRQQVIRDLVTFTAVNIGLLTTLKLSGLADVELDPRSTDWGRARIGPTRIDLLGGMQPAMRQVAQFMSSQGKSAATGQIYDVDRLTLLGRSLQGKLSPAAGFLVDLLSGKTFTGEEMSANPESVKAQAWNRLAPMAMADLAEAVKAHGVAGGLGFGAMSALGGSVMTYQSPFDKQRVLEDTIAKEQGFKDFDEMTNGDGKNGRPKGMGTPKAMEIINADPRIIALQPEIEKYKETRGSRTMTDVAAPFRTEQAADDARVAAGTMTRADWLTNYKDRQRAMGQAEAEYLKENPDASKRFEEEKTKIKDPFALPADASPDTVRTAYFSLFDQYEGETGLISNEDWQKLSPDLDRFRAALTPEQETTLDENLSAGKSELAKEYRADQKKMQAYYDLTDTEWQAFCARVPRAKAYIGMTYDQYRAQVTQQLAAQGKGEGWVDRDPLVLLFEKATGEKRTRFLYQNPEVDALRVVWGLQDIVHTKKAADIYKARTGLAARPPAQ